MDPAASQKMIDLISEVSDVFWATEKAQGRRRLPTCVESPSPVRERPLPIPSLWGRRKRHKALMEGVSLVSERVGPPPLRDHHAARRPVGEV